jgi:D-sedoheptulose 7-phosphate isomerase
LIVIDVRRDIVRDVIEQGIGAVQRCRQLLEDVVLISGEISARLDAGGKLLICGNGGSAADAQHFAAEMIGRFGKERAPVSALALTTDTSVLTAVANDYSFGEVFARQVRGLARAGDVLIGISTSGRSVNVLRAFDAAPTGVLKVALTGVDGPLGESADLALRVPGSTTAEIQAAHLVLIHALSAAIESGLG